MARHPQTDPGGRRFDSTPWTSLLALNDPEHPDYRRHLEALVQRYWKPVYHFIRARGVDRTEDARDLTQDFFTRLIDRRYFEGLSPERGSFRGYLKTAVRHFLINARRADRARAPRDGARLLRFDQAEREWERVAAESRDRAPEEAFDREWARGLFLEAIGELERTLAAAGKDLYFHIFRAFYLEPAGLADRPDREPPKRVMHPELARRFGLAEHDIRNHLDHARVVLRRLLTRRVCEYMDPGAGIEAELDFLLG